MGLHKAEYEALTESQRKLLGYALINISWNPTFNRVELVSAFPIPAATDRSLMMALGFRTELMPFRKNVTEFKLEFHKNNLVRINCDMVRGDRWNCEPSHTIYTFDCDCAPGARYEEKPNTITYFPVCDSSPLREVSVELCDQDNRLLNLRDELTLIRLHVRNRNAARI